MHFLLLLSSVTHKYFDWTAVFFLLLLTVNKIWNILWICAFIQISCGLLCLSDTVYYFAITHTLMCNRVLEETYNVWMNFEELWFSSGCISRFWPKSFNITFRRFIIFFINWFKVSGLEGMILTVVILIIMCPLCTTITVTSALKIWRNVNGWSLFILHDFVSFSWYVLIPWSLRSLEFTASDWTKRYRRTHTLTMSISEWQERYRRLHRSTVVERTPWIWVRRLFGTWYHIINERPNSIWKTLIGREFGWIARKLGNSTRRVTSDDWWTRKLMRRQVRTKFDADKKGLLLKDVWRTVVFYFGYLSLAKNSVPVASPEKMKWGANQILFQRFLSPFFP